jgi:hypothetical protein
VANDRPTTELPVVEHDAPGEPGPLDHDPTAAEAGWDAAPWSAEGVPPVVDDDEEWLVAGPAAGFRLRVPSAILLALLVAAGAFWGGAVAEKHHNPPAAAAGAGARSRAGFEGFGTGATGSGASTVGGGTGATGGATEGTVSGVNGGTLTLTETSGTKVTVKITSSTTVSRTGLGAAGSPKVGDSAVVIGTAGSGGAITATRVTLTQQGVTATRGGFGGGFGGTGTTGAGSTGSSTFGSNFGGAGTGSTGTSPTTTGSSGAGSTFGFGAAGDSAG